MAQRKSTVIVRHIKKLHEEWANFLLNASQRSLRKAALELDSYYLDNADFMDADFIKVFLKQFEKVIQEVGRNEWTVERSRREMRGRIPKKPSQRIQVSPKIKEELDELLHERIRRIVKSREDGRFVPPQ